MTICFKEAAEIIPRMNSHLGDNVICNKKILIHILC